MLRPQPPLTRATAPTAFALRNITDRKARGRLRAAATVEAIGKGEIEWVDAEGWRYQLEAPPVVTISPKDNERAAATVDLKVWDATNTLIFRDRIHAWDGFPVLVPDGTEHEEDDGLGGKVRVSNFRESPVEAARSDLAHTVRVVTKNGPWVKAKPGTVSTFYAFNPGFNGSVQSSSATYATARTGGTLFAGLNDHRLGQNLSGGIMYCWESFLIFNTSAINDGDEISSATLSAYGATDNSSTDFTVVAAESVYDGGGVVTGDWVSGADLAGLSTKASFDTSGFSTTGYNDFTSETAMLTYISKTGSTPFILYSSRHSAADEPAGPEYVVFLDSGAAGTTQDPKLVVTHTPAVTPVSLAGAQGAPSGDVTAKQFEALAGAQPTATGTIARQLSLFRSVAGAQPAPSGALTPEQSLNRSVSGSQPAATGSLSPEQSLARSVAGAQPSATGSIASQKTSFKALAGNQPSATGTIDTGTVEVGLAGSQPSASGTLTPQQSLARSLAGSQPSATGTVASQKTQFKSLAGSQPSATGEVSATTYVGLVGIQPSATGTVAILYIITLTGDQPSPSGAIAARQFLERTVEGNQPAPSGDIFSGVTASVAGAQPAGTGILVALWANRMLAGAQPSAVGVLFRSNAGIAPAAGKATASGLQAGSARVSQLPAGNARVTKLDRGTGRME